MKKIRLSTHQNFAITLFICCLLIVVTATSNAFNPQNLTKTSIVSWSNDIMLSENDSWYSFDPKIAVNGNYIHVVWADNKDNPEFFGNEIYYRRSSNYGKTWDSEIRLTYSNGYSGSPVIGVNGSNIHIAWRDSRSGTTEVYYKRSLDNGDSWGEDVPLSEDDGYGSWGPDIAVSGNNVHVVWEDNGYGVSQLEICYKRSLDNGSVWDDGQGNNNAVRRLTFNTDTRSDMPLIRANDDTLHVFWNDEDTGVYEPYYMRSFDNGNTWTEAKNLTIPDGIPSWIFDVTVEEKKIYIAGGDRKWVSGTPHYSIWYINSSDNGMTWGERVTLVDAKGGYYCGDSKIQAEGSNIHIVWEDNRDDPGAAPDVESGPCEIYYKKSNNYGINWTIDARVTYAPNDSLEADMVVEVGVVHLIWQDKRTGNYEVFYKRSPGFAENITLSVWSNILTTDGVSTSTITAMVTNKTGFPIQGLPVNFNIEAGSGTLLQPNNITDANGTAATTFVAGTVAGNVIINVSCDSIWNKTTITLISSSIKGIKIIPEGPINLYINDPRQFTAIAHDQYGNINTSWQPYWYVEGDIGTINETGFFTATKKGSGAVNCTDNITGVYNVSIVNILNSMPMIEPVSNQTAYEGQLFILQINATDLDDNILAFSDNSTLFDINSTTGLISFAPSYDSAGYYLINITVTDGEATVWQTFKLTVLNVNRKPVLDQIDNQTAYEGLQFVLQITATDPDNDTLTFSDNTDLFDINSTTGLISFTPSYDSAGIYWINITVTDGTDIVWQEFQLTIINVNRAPVVIIASPANNTKFATDDNIVFDAAGSYDPDDETLTYTWISNIDGDIGIAKTFSIKLSAGTHVITLTVSDGGDASSEQITITVESPPPQPGWRFIPGDGAITISVICAVIAIIIILHKLKKIR